MARNIDPRRPYTEEEKEWLLKRAGGADQIKVNERRFAHLTEDEREAVRQEFDSDAALDVEAEERRKKEEAEEFDEEDVAYVQQLTTHEVKEKIRKYGYEPEGENADDFKLELLEIMTELKRGTA